MDRLDELVILLSFTPPNSVGEVNPSRNYAVVLLSAIANSFKVMSVEVLPYEKVVYLLYFSFYNRLSLCFRMESSFLEQIPRCT